MAYSVYGYVTDENGTALSGVKIKPYFKKVDSESDASKWSDTWYESDNLGYYSYSPEDANILTSEGSYKKSKDKFYTVYVYPEADKDSLTITRATFHEHTIPSADDLEVNLEIELKRSPVIASHSFPSAVLTQHQYTMTESSYADTGWINTEPVSQKLTYDTIGVFDGHQVVDTIYEWSEIDPRFVTNSTSDNYTFVEAGVYDLRMVVREKWNTETIVEQQVTVKYNEPVMDFEWDPELTNSWQGDRIKGQELLTFTNTSTSLDAPRMDDPYKYKWTITDELQDGSDNTKVYDDVLYGDEPTHAFQSAGIKTITLLAYWNDGFEDKQVSVVKTLEVYAFDIVPEFDWDILNPKNRAQDITFNPDLTTGDTDKISQYDWVIEDSYPASTVDLETLETGSVFGEETVDGSVEIDNTYNKVDTQYPVVKFHSIGDKVVTLTMTYYNGWVDVTESIEHTVQPVKYSTEPEFTISDTTPMGRDKVVTITNTTSYVIDTVDLGYTIDWVVDDIYSACNLDNQEPGVVTDNTEMHIDVVKELVVNHNYQNTETNDIELVIRYDDGWQMQTKRLVQTVTPEVYPEPIPEFTWDVLVPTDRAETVTFSDETSDPDTRFRAYDWTIPDSYNKWNPDSSGYGVEVVDNTQVISYSTNSELVVTHNFQDNISRSIEMVYYYDDGFCERTVSKTNEITFTEYTIVPVIGNNGPVTGKVEIQYTNDSTGDTNRMLDEKWAWNDKTFPDELDEITTRNDQVVSGIQSFTWQYPSRKPYCVIDGAIAANDNKSVSLEVRIDTGWRDDTEDAGIGTDNTNYGGIVYYVVTELYEATPYEISTDITYECNVEGYTHGL